MGIARRIIVHSLIIAIIVTHLICIGFRQERWPFFRYPMFQGVMRRVSQKTLTLFAVRGAQETQIPLEADPLCLGFDRMRVCSVARTLAENHGENSAQLRHFLELSLTAIRKRWNHLRTGTTRMPSKLRLYEVDHYYPSKSSARPEIKERRLVMEVTAAKGKR